MLYFTSANMTSSLSLFAKETSHVCGTAWRGTQYSLVGGCWVVSQLGSCPDSSQYRGSNLLLGKTVNDCMPRTLEITYKWNNAEGSTK